MLPKSYPTFVYVNLNQFQETRENICVRDKNKNIYMDTWKKRWTKEQNKQLVNFFSFRRYVENQFIQEAKEGTA